MNKSQIKIIVYLFGDHRGELNDIYFEGIYYVLWAKKIHSFSYRTILLPALQTFQPGPETVFGFGLFSSACLYFLISFKILNIFYFYFLRIFSI